MSARKYLKGGALLTGGSIVSSICSFARNIVIARLLSVEDFGIAAIFVITVSLIERMSYIALDQFLVQTADGDDPKVQAVAQAFQALRGVLGAVLLIAFAGPIASLFGVPEVAWAFRVFAIYPLARGFIHLDLARLQRQMRFKAVVWTDTLPQIITLAISAPLALWLGDYRVILLIYAVQAMSHLVASHLLAERAYELSWDTGILRRMLGFGWPLLLNGFLMFGITSGDRAIVGSAFTVEELGWYSAAFGLMMMPSVLIPRVLGRLLLPGLAQDASRNRSERKTQIAMEIFAIAGIIFAVGAWTLGGSVLLLTYGERYAMGVTVIGWLGVMQALRVMKAGPVTLSLARGNSKAILFANGVRSIGLILALLAAFGGMGIQSVAVAGVIGEGAALLTAIALLPKAGSERAITIRVFVKSILLVTAAIVSYELSVRFVSIDQSWLYNLSAGLGFLLVAFFFTLFAFGALREKVFRIVQGLMAEFPRYVNRRIDRRVSREHGR